MSLTYSKLYLVFQRFDSKINLSGLVKRIRRIESALLFELKHISFIKYIYPYKL